MWSRRESPVNESFVEVHASRHLVGSRAMISQKRNHLIVMDLDAEPAHNTSPLGNDDPDQLIGKKSDNGSHGDILSMVRVVRQYLKFFLFLQQAKEHISARLGGKDIEV